MQFYLDGYRPGNPDIKPQDAANVWSPELPEAVDVLVVGAGPAGLMLAAQLSTETSITTRVIERREGPLLIGQADGVATRTVELFDTFGLAEQLVREAYWINETTFWGPSAEDPRRIERVTRVRDIAEGVSEFPHVVVNQARLLSYLAGYMENSPTRLKPDYGLEVRNVVVAGSDDYPVTVSLREVASGTDRSIRAKYVVGCDGARSIVRESIGRTPIGDFANHAWGVLDILGNTDFPDVRFKTIIQSASAGNILLIPREGGYMFRIYVDLGEVDPNERARVREKSQDEVIAIANRVLHPYSLDVQEIAWFSIYEVGQRVTDGFDDVPADLAGIQMPRVFIAGDACHTHSAKAAQGMNVSMPDANNLAWKLAAVIKGRARTHLLSTYSAERHPVAQRLIDFDREWSSMMASAPADAMHPGRMNPRTIADYYVKTRDFTTGVATQYTPDTCLTTVATHQNLATGYPVGKRFHSALVTRWADAKEVQLGHVHRADGAFRLYAFADQSGRKFRELMTLLAESQASPVRMYTPPAADPDSVIDVLGIYQGTHTRLELGSIPAVLRPRKGKYGLVNTQKVFTAGVRHGPDIFEARGIDCAAGAMVLVRPDQYVAAVLPLDAVDKLSAYFAAFLIPVAPQSAGS